jgi:poly(beta-D-mannuronate) lyase
MGTAVPAVAASSPATPSITKVKGTSKASIGERLVYKVTLKNKKSQGSAPTSVALYVSRTSKASEGRPIGTVPVAPLARKSSFTLPVDVVIPADLPAAKYRVLACQTTGGKLSCPERTTLKVSAPPAVLAVEPGAVDFGSVAENASSAPIRLTVRNVGQGASGDIDLEVDGDDDDDFKILSTDCTELAPGQACSVDAVFRPEDDGTSEAELEADPDEGKSASARLVGTAGKASAVTPLTPVAPVAPPAGTAAPVACGASPAAGPAPASVLNLANWKLTLPIDGCDQNSWADEVKQPALSSFSDSRSFYTHPAGTGVVFRAQVDGARTSSNTKYPRSELREMRNGGKDVASWSNGSGKGTHTMTVDAAITRTPAKKADVVAAQIHDKADDVMMIRLRGTRLVVDAEDSRVQLVLDENYVVGTRFNVTITAANGNIRVVYNGARAVDYARSGDGMYFKAGSYTLSNTSFDSPTEYGEVVIYGLAVSHS